jgi:hypothetical protein
VYNKANYENIKYNKCFKEFSKNLFKNFVIKIISKLAFKKKIVCGYNIEKILYNNILYV